MREIAAEREALEAEAKETSVKKNGAPPSGTDVDEDAERVESAKAAACSAIAGTLLSAPLLLSQSPGGLVSLESLGGVFVRRRRCSAWCSDTRRATISETISSRRASWARSA